MKHSNKDNYHKGDYKITPNRVERKEADGIVEKGLIERRGSKKIDGYFLNCGDAQWHSRIRKCHGKIPLSG
jgi:hypothetical protein